MTQSSDDTMGMAWWNHITDAERAKWMDRAGSTGSAKDAWEAFKAHTLLGEVREP
jgi:hypothetical protein